MKKILAMLLFIPSLSFAQDRAFLINNQYLWTITDEQCGHLANPDELPIKYAYVEDVKTHAKMEGCALDDGTNIEFQLINEVEKKLVTIKIPTNKFTAKYGM